PLTVQNVINLWGQDQARIVYGGSPLGGLNAPPVFSYTDLNDMQLPDGRPIGHTEVHEFYQDYYINPILPPSPPPGGGRKSRPGKAPVFEPDEVLVGRLSVATTLSFADSVSGVPALPERSPVVGKVK